MLKNELVTIKKFNLIGEDERGITAEFFLPRNQGEFLFFTRKKHSLSGNTYHQGINSGTNPKVFILLSGSISLNYRKIGENVAHQVVIDAPAVIEVSTYVTHNMVALSDFTMLEANSINDLQQDRIRENVDLTEDNFA
jgi:hypothetical protein